MIKTLLTIALLSVASPSFADGTWAANHPRRDQVNDRLANQNRRIDNGVKSGKLSPQQAHQLHRQDHAIRSQERADAAAHGGHITKHEERQLNREENQSSRQIYSEKH
jgi:F0F1-type ATP synthase membrane subunit b/b'